MREVKLEDLAWRTKFSYKGVMYEKDDTLQGDKVRCFPILGGQVQKALVEWLPREAWVEVSYK